MNRDTYINVDQSELKQCIKFSVMYIQSPHLIKDKCNIQYYPELNPTPQILDAGKHMLLGNIPESWSAVCSKNDPIPTLLRLVNMLLSRRKIYVLLVQVHGTFRKILFIVKERLVVIYSHITL